MLYNRFLSPLDGNTLSYLEGDVPASLVNIEHSSKATDTTDTRVRVGCHYDEVLQSAPVCP